MLMVFLPNFRSAGLVKIFDTANICDIDPRVGKFSNLEWSSFAQPLALLILYHLIIYQIQHLLSPPTVQDQVMEVNYDYHCFFESRLDSPDGERTRWK